MKKMETIFHSDRKKLSVSATRKFFQLIRGLSNSRDEIVISLPGGRSVRDFYVRIDEKSSLLPRADWKKLHFFMTDERLVPPGSEESNFSQADELLLTPLIDKGLVSKNQVHRFPTEKSNLDEALSGYREDLEEISGGVVHIPVLGVGGDGHIGSLFPEREELTTSAKGFLLVNDSPKPPKRRVTVSPYIVRNSLHPILFFLGEEKRQAYECFSSEAKDYRDCPCTLAKTGRSGVCHVVTDLELNKKPS